MIHSIVISEVIFVMSSEQNEEMRFWIYSRIRMYQCHGDCQFFSEIGETILARANCIDIFYYLFFL